MMAAMPAAPSPYLSAIAQLYPTTHAVLAEIANLEAILTLPKPTVHIVSDVHGEAVKFRHVVNNASGSLRPRLERLFAGRLAAAEITELLNLFYYPRETWQKLTATDGAPPARRALLERLLPRSVEVLRELARGYTLKHVGRILPDPFDELFFELIFGDAQARRPEFVAKLIEPFVRTGRDLELLRMAARAVRNLSVGELIVAGDLGDRGPRIDKVIEHMRQQPSCSVTWGNHDASWMGACLGAPALIATVLRVSIRYRRLTQLEEGYGISLAPVERLVKTVYGDDPAERFPGKGEGLRDPLTIARMQKAMSIIQFKLEGQLLRRHPEWGLAHRNLLERIDPEAGTVEIDGKVHPLLDTRFPTVDWADPCKLSADEEKCMDRVRQAFVASTALWQQMSFVARVGAMWLRRDQALVFHGCLPVDDAGAPLDFVVDGEPRRGRALFDALDAVVQRSFRAPDGIAAPREADLDLFWYLWSGPRSPCFGKDRMATFETYLVADQDAQKEAKNPYFKKIHEPEFCRRVLAEFGVDPAHGLIVNGHVPVHPEKGESPVKQSGQAVTIDGAFAAAYGDRGYSLVLDATRVYLAEHHHFGSVDDAVSLGADIVPSVTDLKVYDSPRTVGDTEKGPLLRREIAVLEELAAAYAANEVKESVPT
jgi:fructose-1,6-bisphosphatase-3